MNSHLRTKAILVNKPFFPYHLAFEIKMNSRGRKYTYSSQPELVCRTVLK